MAVSSHFIVNGLAEQTHLGGYLRLTLSKKSLAHQLEKKVPKEPSNRKNRLLTN